MAHETGSDDVSHDLTYVLPPDATAPAIARQYVRDLGDRLSAVLLDDAVLLVSEVVTNAVQHGRPDITLRIRLDPPGIGVAVHDLGDGGVAQRPELPDVDAISGRGLFITAALATAWGVDRHANAGTGHTVWFELHPPAPA